MVAALGLMAFMASAAQAEWRVNLKTMSANTLVTPSVHLDGILLVPVQNLEILCTEIIGEDLLLLAGTLTTLGTLAFNNCITRQKGVESKGCKPINQPIKATGTGHLILHNSRTYVLFSPKAGLPFATIFFNEETCALAPENKVTGNLVAECVVLSGGAEVGSDCATEEALHILKQAPQALFNGENGLTKDELRFGANPAFLDGSANVVLGAPSTGQKFAGIG